MTAITPSATFVFKRNANGWVTEERQTIAGETIRVLKEYDRMGDVTRRTTSLGHLLEAQRDLCGRPVKLLLDEQSQIDLAYDALGREVVRRLPAGGAV